MTFHLGRIRPYPSIYPEWKTAVTQDVLLMGWVAAFFALLLPFYLVIPASNNKLSRFVRVTVFLLLGLIIMLCNFGQSWEYGQITTTTQYKAGTADSIKADIGVYLSLRSVNITLKGKQVDENSSLAGETIDYNERFSWTWNQGRPGFGSFAGQLHRDFRAAQRRGAPYPILWIAEYFTFDGEGIRFGRHYRESGWYAHILIWMAFPMWILTVFLFKMVVKYAAIALIGTGILLVIPPMIWALNRNFIELQILFADDILRTYYGWCWYFSLFTGVICILFGGILLLLNKWYNTQLNKFFGTNPYKILDLDDEIVENKKPNIGPERETDIEMNSVKVAEKSGCMRQVTVRGRGTSSHNHGSKHFEMPSESGSTPTHSHLGSPAVSPTKQETFAAFEHSGSHYSRQSHNPTCKTINEDSECSIGNTLVHAHGSQQLQLPILFDDDDLDNDHPPVFESPRNETHHRCSNISLIQKEI